MRNETIDKYLDQQGITPNNWGKERIEIGEDEHRITALNPVGVIGTIAECYSKENALVIANSRKSLRDWIMVAWESEVHKNVFELENVYKLATENIEASLGKPWSEVCEELEWMEVGNQGADMNEELERMEG